MRGGGEEGRDRYWTVFTSSSRRLSDESCFEMFQSDSNGRTKEADGAAGGDDPDVCLQCLLLTRRVEQSSGTTLFIIGHLAQQSSERILSLA